MENMERDNIENNINNKDAFWIDEGDYIITEYDPLDIYKCSHCNIFITINKYDNYCPNCGYKMKEIKKTYLNNRICRNVY